MFGLFRAGGLAAAFSVFAALFAVPSLASAAPAAPVTATPMAFVPAPRPGVASPSGGQSADRVAPPSITLTEAMLAPATVQRQLSLRDLVIAFVDYGNQDEQQQCLATAVYFEARSEPLEGQLAVAQVVLNRAASGIYPPAICDVVTQPAQFSFVRAGRFPAIDRDSDAWHKALAIADIARKKLIQKIASNVLWYHANYVAPSWGRRLTRAIRVGSHIFYN